MRVSTGLPPGPILSKNKTYVSEKMMKLTVTINLINRILIYVYHIYRIYSFYCTTNYTKPFFRTIICDFLRKSMII